MSTQSDESSLTNFLMDGLHVFHDPQFIDMIDLPTFGEIINVDTFIDPAEKDVVMYDEVFAIEFNEEQRRRLLSVRDFLIDRYLSHFKHVRLKGCCIWDGVDDGSARFHNDNEDEMNATFLCYFNDTSPEVGGALQVRHHNCIENQKLVYPQAGDIVWLNQNVRFDHKANRSIKPRVLAGFDFFIKDLK